MCICLKKKPTPNPQTEKTPTQNNGCSGAAPFCSIVFSAACVARGGCCYPGYENSVCVLLPELEKYKKNTVSYGKNLVNISMSMIQYVLSRIVVGWVFGCMLLLGFFGVWVWFVVCVFVLNFELSCIRGAADSNFNSASIFHSALEYSVVEHFTYFVYTQKQIFHSVACWKYFFL